MKALKEQLFKKKLHFDDSVFLKGKSCTMSMEEMLGQTTEHALSCANTHFSDAFLDKNGDRHQIDEFGNRVAGSYNRKKGRSDSMHSHATTEVLDERKVSFVHIGGLAKNDENSEDSFGEHDMVYYNKDDMT
jgi:hypothetical protein